MAKRAVFYQLTQKFVNNEQDIPEGPRQVLYYSLAVGHHVGVLDCFTSLMEIPLERYAEWVSRIPEGEGRHKLEGLLKWGEIEINRSHVTALLPALTDSLSAMDTMQVQWTKELIRNLNLMKAEPAMYLMVRKCV